eukprot:gene1884-2961_t
MPAEGTGSKGDGKPCRGDRTHRIASSSSGDDSGEEEMRCCVCLIAEEFVDMVRVDGLLVVRNTLTQRCAVCMQWKVLGPRGGMCAVCYGGCQRPLRYQCDRCHGTQRIPHPMYRYQPLPTGTPAAAHLLPLPPIFVGDPCGKPLWETTPAPALARPSLLC